MERPEGSNEMPPGVKAMESESSSTPAPAAPKEAPKPTPAPASAAPSTSTPKPAPTSAPVQEDVNMDGDEDEDAVAKKEADELKAQGTVAYKARKFEEAAELYSKAWERSPKDVTYLTNLSGEFQLVFAAHDPRFSMELRNRESRERAHP